MYRIKKQIRAMAIAVMMLAGIWLCDTTVQAASADNSLSSIELSEGTLSPSFQYNVVDYQVSVGSDTDSIEVRATTSHEAADILGGTGTHQLEDGENTVRILVEAENGNQAVYTIKIVRGASADTSAGNEGDDTDGDTDGDSAGTDTPETDSPEADTPDDTGTEVLSGAEGYTIAETIPEEIIPADFTQTTANYQGAECPALQYDKGAVTLLYMVNEQEEGMLFVYDEMAENVYPFVKLSAGEKYLLVLQAPAEAVLGENYISATLDIDNKNIPTAFQRVAEDTPEFYQIYGMDSEGTAGWYQYDSVGGTYQRYQEIIVEETNVTESDEYLFLKNAYNELSEKYSGLKQRDTRYLTGLIIAVAVLLIILVNLLLFRRNRGEGRKSKHSDEIFEEDTAKQAKAKPRKKQRDAALFDDFEDEPDFLSGGKLTPEKKEKTKKNEKAEEKAKPEKKEKSEKKRFGKRKDIFDENDQGVFFEDEESVTETSTKDHVSLDDDFEILDLND